MILEDQVTKSLESAVRKMSRGSSPLFGSSPGASTETFSGLSGLAKGYEQYRESLTLLRPTTEYGEPSSDDLSSEWESGSEEPSIKVTLAEPLASNLALNAAVRRGSLKKMIPPVSNLNSCSNSSDKVTKSTQNETEEQQNKSHKRVSSEKNITSRVFHILDLLEA